MEAGFFMDIRERSRLLGIDLDEKETVGIEKVLETSVSRLYFTDDLVLKVYQPEHSLIVGLDDPGIRADYLRREMTLGEEINRGKASIYKGVCRLRFGDDSEEEAWALVMDRFRDEQRMEAMLRDDQLRSDHVEDAIEAIIDFYQRQPALSEVYDSEMAQALQREIVPFLRNAFSFDFMTSQLGNVLNLSLVGRIVQKVDSFLEARQEELRRAAAVFKEEHGDTKITNMYIGNGRVGDENRVYILDALGFDLKPGAAYAFESGQSFPNEWRVNDLRSALAYFALYFDYYDPDNFSQWLEIINNKYRQMTEADLGLDEDPEFWFYLNYRAMVQAKVAAIEADQARQGGNENLFTEKKKEAATLTTKADGYLDMALEKAELDLVYSA